MKSQRRKLCVIGIDGVPWTFLRQSIAAGRFPHLARLATGGIHRMDSVMPPVSSVAWTTFATGMNPAGHGILGFVDRVPRTGELFIPTARNVTAPTLWGRLTRSGLKSAVINVPCTYPPVQINGKLVSCFLATDLAKATWPPQLATRLSEIGYIIDPDPWKARTDLSGFLDDLFTALDRRLAATLEIFASDDFDFMISHIMETDRLGHFFWDRLYDPADPFRPRLLELLDRVDSFIATIAESIPSGTPMIVLSDHGFCPLKSEVHINHALREAGLLTPSSEDAKNICHLTRETVAFSLIPGRIYINLKGREMNGSVAPCDYEARIAEVSALLESLEDPATGEKVIASIHRREDIYHGPHADAAPDLIALPIDGYDLKGTVASPSLFTRGHIVGMHTYDDAALCLRGFDLTDSGRFSITDIAPSILAYFAIDHAPLDGKIIFRQSDNAG